MTEIRFNRRERVAPVAGLAFPAMEGEEKMKPILWLAVGIFVMALIAAAIVGTIAESTDAAESPKVLLSYHLVNSG